MACASRLVKSESAFSAVAWLVAAAAIAVSTLIFKPKVFHGESRRAEDSKHATAQLEAAAAAQGSNAAASVVKIGEANAAAPDSPSKDFIAREVPAALAHLPAPDPLALLEAEKRRAAVMEGRADEAARLYGIEANRSAELQKQLSAALAARHAADSALSEAAAGQLAAERQRTLAAVFAGLVFVLWAYARLFSISPGSLGAIAADIRAGSNPITAMDIHLAPWLHSKVSAAAKLAYDMPKKFPPDIAG